MSKPHYRDAYLEGAIEDLIEVQDFYEQQSQGSGIEFAEAVTTRLDLVLEFPEAHVVFSEPGVRRVSVGSFPFFVIYKLVEDVVYVIAVVHKKRNPRFWLPRLKSFE